jgi:hypothetical protein
VLSDATSCIRYVRSVLNVNVEIPAKEPFAGYLLLLGYGTSRCLGYWWLNGSRCVGIFMNSGIMSSLAGRLAWRACNFSSDMSDNGARGHRTIRKKPNNNWLPDDGLQLYSTVHTYADQYLYLLYDYQVPGNSGSRPSSFVPPAFRSSYGGVATE